MVLKTLLRRRRRVVAPGEAHEFLSERSVSINSEKINIDTIDQRASIARHVHRDPSGQEKMALDPLERIGSSATRGQCHRRVSTERTNLVLLWAARSERCEECTHIKEVEAAISFEVRDWVHAPECGEERRDIEEVQAPVAGQVRCAAAHAERAVRVDVVGFEIRDTEVTDLPSRDEEPVAADGGGQACAFCGI